MLNFVLFALLQGNIFVGSGMNLGTDFLNTSIRVAPSVSVHVFPFSIRNIGVFNTFEWRNYRFNLYPFEVGIKNKTFVVGSTFRILKPHIQPSFRIGLMHFRENSDVTFLDDVFIKTKAKKNTLFLGSGAYIKIWKRFYIDPEVSIAVSGRPPWKTAIKAGWIF